MLYCLRSWPNSSCETESACRCDGDRGGIGGEKKYISDWYERKYSHMRGVWKGGGYVLSIKKLGLYSSEESEE